MIEFEGFIYPPGPYHENKKPDWDYSTIVHALILDEDEANRMILNGFKGWENLFVAYRGDTIIGYQEMGYDSIDINIELGGQVLSSTLSEEDAAEVSVELEKRTRNAALGEYFG